MTEKKEAGSTPSLQEMMEMFLTVNLAQKSKTTPTERKPAKPIRNPDSEFVEVIMAPKMEGALKSRGPFKMFCSIGDTGKQLINVYEWTKNHWRYINEEEGKAIVQEWMQDDFELKLKYSDKRSEAVWNAAKTRLSRDDAKPGIVNGEDDVLTEGKSLNRGKPVVFPLMNHYLVLKNGKVYVEKPNPAYLIRHVLNFDIGPFLFDEQTEYVPKPVDPNTKFGEYLNRTFPDLAVRAVVQEFFASAFFENSFQKCLWLIGNGSNGKSTLNKILQKVVPSFRATSFKALKGEFALHNLMPATAIGISEVIEGSTIEEDTFKQLVGGDEMTVNRKNKDIINHRFLAKFFMAVNVFPHIKDTTTGFWRRNTIVEVNNSLSDEAMILDYENQIVSSPASMICLLDWIIEGALRIIARGNIIPDSEMPQSIQDTKKRLRYKNNSVAQWFECVGLRLSDDGEEHMSKASILASYKDFCFEVLGGKQPMGEERFWETIRQQLNVTADQIKGSNVRRNGKQTPVVPLTLAPKKTAIEQMMDIPLPPLEVILKNGAVEHSLSVH